MKIVILAGGRGSRLDGATAFRPKALVTIGGRPIIEHLIDYYRYFGHDEFVIATGYRGDCFLTHFSAQPVDDRCSKAVLPGNVSLELVDTGPDTSTGGRLKRVKPYLADRRFMLTWCDGLANVDLDALVKFHVSHGRLATVTAVHPPPRFGRLSLAGDHVVKFGEKTEHANEWINGAFFVLQPEVLDLIEDDDTSWEHGPMMELVRQNQLMAFRHHGFWRCMDTQAERNQLEQLWQRGQAPWKVA
jgi:glucose-1-phosphate cytidylyltransferase